MVLLKISLYCLAIERLHGDILVDNTEISDSSDSFRNKHIMWDCTQSVFANLEILEFLDLEFAVEYNFKLIIIFTLPQILLHSHYFDSIGSKAYT